MSQTRAPGPESRPELFARTPVSSPRSSGLWSSSSCTRSVYALGDRVVARANALLICGGDPGSSLMGHRIAPLLCSRASCSARTVLPAVASTRCVWRCSSRSAARVTTSTRGSSGTSPCSGRSCSDGSSAALAVRVYASWPQSLDRCSPRPGPAASRSRSCLRAVVTHRGTPVAFIIVAYAFIGLLDLRLAACGRGA